MHILIAVESWIQSCLSLMYRGKCMLSSLLNVKFFLIIFKLKKYDTKWERSIMARFCLEYECLEVVWVVAWNLPQACKFYSSDIAIRREAIKQERNAS